MPLQPADKTADVIPPNERWVHEPAHKARLDAAVAWAAETPASDANCDAILERFAESVKD